MVGAEGGGGGGVSFLFFSVWWWWCCYCWSFEFVEDGGVWVLGGGVEEGTES